MPRPPPEGFPVVLGPLGGLVVFAMILIFKLFFLSQLFELRAHFFLLHYYLAGEGELLLIRFHHGPASLQVAAGAVNSY